MSNLKHVLNLTCGRGWRRLLRHKKEEQVNATTDIRVLAEENVAVVNFKLSQIFFFSLA